MSTCGKNLSYWCRHSSWRITAKRTLFSCNCNGICTLHEDMIDDTITDVKSICPEFEPAESLDKTK